MNDRESSPLRRVAVVGNHLPRLCGIATFTRDLRTALVKEIPQTDWLVVAVNDAGQRYDYPPEVRFQIDVDELDSYRAAAQFLNDSGVSAVSLQHEFGIYGGSAGRHVTALLAALRAPVLTTLHTILATPDDAQRAAMADLIQHSARLVTMSQSGAGLLRGVYGVPASSIDVVPHGIPMVPVDTTAKGRLGLAGGRVMLTFGLLSPGKGIEHAIGALPAITARFPNVVYLVVGATHPQVRAREGERYRDGLLAHAERLGVTEQVRFVDRFVSQAELVEYLSAADIYVTPYLDPEQSTSGTMAYAVGAGKAVVSTPYRYARELLAEGGGVLVPWRSAEGIARAVIDLFGDAARYQSVCARAAERGRSMVWPKVARSYWRSLLETASPGTARRPRPHLVETTADPLPELDLSHLRVLTDGVGLFQHALLAVPRSEEGYTLDDNARGLLLTTSLHARQFPDEPLRQRLEATYYAFVRRAFDGRSGRFRNFMSYSRTWLEEVGSEDSHGRAIWSLGSLVGHSTSAPLQSGSDYLLRASLRRIGRLTSPRAWAFAVLGIEAALARYPRDAGLTMALEETSRRLLDLFARHAEPSWPWCEDSLTYANARLPHALLAAGARLSDQPMLAAGLRALTWLVELQRSPAGDFSPVGSNGFFPRHGVRALYDQQPIEAGATVAACVRAHEVTGEAVWLRRARWALAWFLGKNTLGQPLFDLNTGGCRDGLHEDRRNENQGAESTLAFLQALSDVCAATRVATVDSNQEPKTRAVIAPQLEVAHPR